MAYQALASAFERFAYDMGLSDAKEAVHLRYLNSVVLGTANYYLLELILKHKSSLYDAKSHAAT
jgi:hypothetical protein